MDNLVNKYELMFQNPEDRFPGYADSFEKFEEECQMCPDSILEPAIKRLFPQSKDTPWERISGAAKAMVRSVIVDSFRAMKA